MTTTTKAASIREQVNLINKHYKTMQKTVLKLMVHPEATEADIQTARELLLATATALTAAHAKFLAAGYDVDKLEGITRKYKL